MQDSAIGKVVIDDQAGDAFQRGGRSRGRLSPRGQRNQHVELTAFIQLARNPHLAAHQGDQAHGNRQAEPGATVAAGL